MKVFNLGCPQDHRFEGWFAAADAFDTQRERGLIECPFCGSREIRKLLSSPRLNLSQKPAARPPGAADASGEGGVVARAGEPGSGRRGAAVRSHVKGASQRSTGGPGSEDGGGVDPARVQAAFLQMVRQVIASTEDVGNRFAEEARRIHYNETAGRPIRGSATQEEAEALRDEGIDVVSLPIPSGLKEPLQ